MMLEETASARDQRLDVLVLRAERYGVNFSDIPPSNEWAALKYRGKTIAEVWFKPDGDPFALTFRVPRQSFQIPDLAQRLTMENLLRAVGVTKDEVESWSQGETSPPALDGTKPDPEHPLPPPPEDAAHLTIRVRLKPPAHQAPARTDGGEPEIPAEKWQDLEARWNAILGLEATVETLRISMESLRMEMEASLSRMLTGDEKVNALNADVAQWNQAKSRVIYALPKVRDFIHRSTWAKGAPERKKLEELFKDSTRPPLSSAEMEKLQRQLENLLKDRQILSAQGVSVHQEGKRVAGDVQGALRQLQSNAAANAVKKRAAARSKGKSF